MSSSCSRGLPSHWTVLRSDVGLYVRQHEALHDENRHSAKPEHVAFEGQVLGVLQGRPTVVRLLHTSMIESVRWHASSACGTHTPTGSREMRSDTGGHARLVQHYPPPHQPQINVRGKRNAYDAYTAA